MIAIVVPAHNEQAFIGRCLASLRAAASCPGLVGEPVTLIVVLDSCTDDTAAIAQEAGALLISVRSRNVGHARALGAQHAIDIGARWLAFTDADSVVAPDWLSAQLRLASDAVCGTITVDDWSDYVESVRRQHEATYIDADGHRHIHGANLGVSTRAYVRAGGFPALRSSEDVALVRALQDRGCSIAWSAAPRVRTSARRDFRAPGGFGAALRVADNAVAQGQLR